MSDIREIGVKNAKKGLFTRAINYFELAISSGDIHALNDLGVVKERQGDYSKSLEYYYKAAVLGNRDAIVNIAKDFLFGRGVEHDRNMALKFFKRAAYLGHPNGYYWIVAEYCKDQPLEKKIEFLKKGYEVEQDWPHEYSCAMQLGYTLEFNNRQEEAIPYYENAIEKGCVQGMYNLGMVYLQLNKPEKAINCLKMAADGNYPDAYAVLAKEYYKGENVEKDLDTCMAYLAESINLNSPKGRLFYIELALNKEFDASKEEIESQIKKFFNHQYFLDYMGTYNNIKENHINDLDWESIESETIDDKPYVEE